MAASPPGSRTATLRLKYNPPDCGTRIVKPHASDTHYRVMRNRVRILFFLSLSVSFFVSVCPFLCLFIRLCICLCLFRCLCLCRCFCLFLCLYLSLISAEVLLNNLIIIAPFMNVLKQRNNLASCIYFIRAILF